MLPIGTKLLEKYLGRLGGRGEGKSLEIQLVGTS